MRYRVWSSHCGDPSGILEIFESDSDKKAIAKVKAKEKEPEHEWDYLRLERIDVEEKVTKLY